ncbi:MAG: transposase [Methanocorpusculum sp.]|nr:transposase [Methanocorpusculum sp.]
MKLPQRKFQRLKNYNYSQNNAYFITICTQNRLPLFGKIENSNLILNNAGLMVFNKFEEISEFYPDIIIDKFIVMPNHLHAIMLIQHDGTAQGPFPTLSEYIKRFKTLTTKLYIDFVKKGEYPPFDKKIWQKSYYDHIIHNEAEYQKICEYIDTNPLKWELDKYYI